MLLAWRERPFCATAHAFAQSKLWKNIAASQWAWKVKSISIKWIQMRRICYNRQRIRNLNQVSRWAGLFRGLRNRVRNLFWQPGTFRASFSNISSDKGPKSMQQAKLRRIAEKAIVASCVECKHRLEPPLAVCCCLFVLRYTPPKAPQRSKRL